MNRHLAAATTEAAPKYEGSAGCVYCGLPIRAAGKMRHTEEYCCLGCELAADIASDSTDTDGVIGRTALRLGLAIFFSMNVMVFTMALWSWDAYSISASAHAAIYKDLLRLACLLFATPVVLILGKPLVTSVASQLHRRLITADILLVTGVSIAYAYSILSIVTGSEHIYFEVACMILVAVTLGRWLEAEGKQRAMKSLESLQNLLPTTARWIDNGQVKTVSLEQITRGRTIRVLPGERIPLDGKVSSGQSYVDQRLVTGESCAFHVGVGDQVFGGATTLDGCLDICVTATNREGVIQRLIQAVRETARQTTRPERLADRLASVFAPLVFAITVAVFLTHYHSKDLQTAMMASMSVALIACPCALAIATPLAMWAALSKAGEQGVVFRTGDDLVALAEIDHVCLDKTGTLTTGQPRLAQSVYNDNDKRLAIHIARMLAERTRHPLANALIAELPADESNTSICVDSATTIPGKGIRAEITISLENSSPLPTRAVLGSEACCHEHALKFSEAMMAAKREADATCNSIVFIGWNGWVRASFVFHESLRASTRNATDQLKDLNLGVTLLTGDHFRRANRVADELKIDCQADLLPSDKEAAIHRLKSKGKRIAMVGDGINDAPALALADVGIALGCGVEVSRDAADVCLMSSDLRLLPWAIDLARRTKITIRRNLLWAFAYNTVGIGLAAAGKLNPIFAASAMVLSSGFVIVESLRLSVGEGPVELSPQKATQSLDPEACAAEPVIASDRVVRA